jgi:hypothetical protein
MILKLKAFLSGIREVHLDVTSNWDDQFGEHIQDWYERGRYCAALLVRREILR